MAFYGTGIALLVRKKLLNEEIMKSFTILILILITSFSSKANDVIDHDEIAKMLAESKESNSREDYRTLGIIDNYERHIYNNYNIKLNIESLKKSIKVNGLYKGLIAPTIVDLDTALAMGDIRHAHNFASMIAVLDPNLGSKLSRTLGLGTETFSVVEIGGENRAGSISDFRSSVGPLFNDAREKNDFSASNVIRSCVSGCTVGTGVGIIAGGIAGGVGGGLATGGAAIIPAAVTGGKVGGDFGCVAGCLGQILKDFIEEDEPVVSTDPINEDPVEVDDEPVVESGPVTTDDDPKDDDEDNDRIINPDMYGSSRIINPEFQGNGRVIDTGTEGYDANVLLELGLVYLRESFSQSYERVNPRLINYVNNMN